MKPVGLLEVKVRPRKIVYVKGEPEERGVYCTFYESNTEESRVLGNKYVNLPFKYSKELLERTMESAARYYFA